MLVDFRRGGGKHLVDEESSGEGIEGELLVWGRRASELVGDMKWSVVSLLEMKGI